MIGRNRSRAASTVASMSGLPSSNNCLANSTIRMAFFAARPTSTRKPICTKISIGSDATIMPTTAQSKHMGTTRITAKGSRQLSYLAASTRKIAPTPRANMMTTCAPSWSCRYMISVHS